MIISFDNGLKGEPAPTHSLARDYYVSPEVFEAELDRFLTAHWIMAGHESEVPEPGDYFRFDVMGYSLIIVRGADGSVRAMQNVCRHRGSRLYEDARGTISLIRCRYHGWAYRLNGEVIASRHLPESLAKEDYSLIRCGVAVFAGLIFVSLQPERAPDFAALTQHLQPYLGRYQMAGCKVIATENYHLTANWKLAVENNLECYHCLMCHPQYTEANAFVRADEKVSAAHVDQFNSYQETWRARLSAFNLLTGRTELVTVGGQPSRAGVWPLAPGQVTGSHEGKPVAPLLGNLSVYDESITTAAFGFLSYVGAMCDYVLLITYVPQTVHTTQVIAKWLVRADAKEGIDYQPDKVKWLWDETTKQDKRIVELNAAGVGSRGYVPGPYSTLEALTADFVGRYLRLMR